MLIPFCRQDRFIKAVIARAKLAWKPSSEPDSARGEDINQRQVIRQVHNAQIAVAVPFFLTNGFQRKAGAERNHHNLMIMRDMPAQRAVVIHARVISAAINRCDVPCRRIATNIRAKQWRSRWARPLIPSPHQTAIHPHCPAHPQDHPLRAYSLAIPLARRRRQLCQGRPPARADQRPV